MINLTTLQCIFANKMAMYATKIQAGVTCGISKCDLYTAYNYWQIALAQSVNNCDITPDVLTKILSHQANESITIQPCC